MTKQWTERWNGYVKQNNGRTLTPRQLRRIKRKDNKTSKEKT